MCVITLARKRRPTSDEVEKMFKRNDHGAGIAWREGDDVVWEKGLTLDEVQVLAGEAPLPFVLHFRLQSCGGVLKELCHPFPIAKGISCELGGRTKGAVLFHNGHWTKWRENGLEAIIKNKIKTPEGKWTDTRTMALLCQLHGKEILEFIDEKVILFSPTRIDIWKPDLFTLVDDLLVSNRLWETWTPYQVTDHRRHLGSVHYPGGQRFEDVEDDRRICQYSTCREDAINGGRFCAQHQPACREKGCVASRVGMSEYCSAHQPLCVEVDCTNRRIVGEKHCAHHLYMLSRKKDEEIGLKTPSKVEVVTPSTNGAALQPLGAPGVTPSITTFHRGAGTVQEGADQQGEAEGDPSELGAVSKGLPGQSHLDSPTPLREILAARRWTTSINPAALKPSPTQTALAILENRTRGFSPSGPFVEPLLM